MNQHTPVRTRAGTTRAAEGMARRAWSVTAIEAMVAAGIIDKDERFEMISGEVQRTVTDEFGVIQETTLRLDDKSLLEPDFCIFPGTMRPGDIRGYGDLLAIEVADSGLSYDRGRKIGIYGAYGIAEVWVVDANSLVTRIHRTLGAEGFRGVSETGSTETITPPRVPQLSMNLAALGLLPATA